MIYLADRALIEISGEEAAPFLQNIITNDLSTVADGKMIYACLLTPQGQFLHEFFISAHENGFFLEVDKSRKEDLLRRLSLYKLRSKVTLNDVSEAWQVYALAEKGCADPRNPALKARFYSKETLPTQKANVYHDLCISLGIPSKVSAFRIEKDYLADLNFDKLAVNFDKGCFVGQELTARMHHRGLIKRRLLLIEGEDLQPEQLLLQDSHEVGQIRQINSLEHQALAVVKMEAFARMDNTPVFTFDKKEILVKKPLWL